MTCITQPTTTEHLSESGDDVDEEPVRFWREHIDASQEHRIHFVEADGCDSFAIARASSDLGFVVLQVNGARVRTKDHLMDEFSRGGQFPSYFGRNWDSLVDALRDLSWLPPGKGYVVLIERADGLLSMGPREFTTFVEVLGAVIKDRRDEQDEGVKPFHVVLCGSAFVKAALQSTLTETLCDHP